MATVQAFLGVGDDTEAVLGWFRALPHRIVEHDRPDAAVLHFANLGPLAETDGSIDQGQSPLAWIVKPRVVRRALWTMGEVLFPATPLKQRFPELHKISRNLSKWFRQFEHVYSWKRPQESAWSYYLEGGIRNRHVELFALPEAQRALQRGQYFIHPEDNEVVLDRVCRALRLRGVDVGDET